MLNRFGRGNEPIEHQVNEYWRAIACDHEGLALEFVMATSAYTSRVAAKLTQLSAWPEHADDLTEEIEFLIARLIRCRELLSYDESLGGYFAARQKGGDG